MLMKTPSWQMTGAEIHSAQFPGFLTLSRCLFFPLATFFFGKVEKSLQVVLTPPDSFLPPFPPSVLSPDFPHCLISLYQHQTCDLIMTFKVSNSLFLSLLSFQFSLFTQGFGARSLKTCFASYKSAG